MEPNTLNMHRKAHDSENLKITTGGEFRKLLVSL